MQLHLLLFRDTKYHEKAEKVIYSIDGPIETQRYEFPNSFVGGIPTSLRESGQQWDFR